MNSKKLNRLIKTLEIVKLLKDGTNVSNLCKKFEINRRTFYKHILRCIELGLVHKKDNYELTQLGKTTLIESKHLEYSTPVQQKSEYPKRYIVSSATSNTQLNRPFWNAVQNYSTYVKAEIVLLPVYYKNISLMSSRTEEDEKFLPEIEKYLCEDRTHLGKNLALMCDIPISPTAKYPLTGFDTISGDKSAIFGSPNLAMTAVATPSLKLPKLLYTTGSISKPNYSKTKTGKIGELNHTNSALIIECEDENTFHIRNLVWEEETQDFYDLNLKITEYNISEINEVPAIVFGDLHHKFLDENMEKYAFFGKTSLTNFLKPQEIVLHDALDFYSENHHHKGASIKFKKFIDNDTCIKTELDNLVEFHNKLSQTGSKILYVDSNHDRALDRFLDEADIRNNPQNALIYHELNAQKYRYYIENGHMPNSLYLYIKDRIIKKDLPSVQFLDSELGYTIKGINVSMHGDIGVNGTRGNIRGYGKIGEKSIIGHSHTPGIALGVYQLGTSSKLQLGYNKGPSSWMHTACIIYPNGTRTLIHFIEGKYKL